MAEFERGRVRRIILEFEYPDGGLKTLDVDSPSEVSMIAFDEHWIREEDRKLFNATEGDWRQNPAMSVYFDRRADRRVLELPAEPHLRRAAN
jgi:hypothetical protein